MSSFSHLAPHAHKLISDPDHPLCAHGEEDLEDFNDYRRGGLYPITLGDELDCYKIVHKLGSGSTSTVWLAWDNTEKRNVSLKIMKAESEADYSKELRLEKEINRASDQQSGRKFILRHYRQFKAKSRNGWHHCLVTEAVGPPLAAVRWAWGNYDDNDNPVLPIDLAKKFTTQLARGLDHLHACGIMHGDLYASNVAVKVPGLDAWDPEQIKNVFPVYKYQITRRDGKPPGHQAPHDAIYPMSFLDLEKGLLSREIRITDLGEATKKITRRAKELNIPSPYCAPEVYFEHEVGLPADIWAFACTTFDIFGNSHLFKIEKRSQGDAMIRMYSTLEGKLPDDWWQKWEGRSRYFEKNGDRKSKMFKKWPEPLEKRIRDIRPSFHSLSSREADELEELLRACLVYEPRRRANSEEVLSLLPNSWKSL